jgi:hypothetical protein
MFYLTKLWGDCFVGDLQEKSAMVGILLPDKTPAFGEMLGVDAIHCKRLGYGIVDVPRISWRGSEEGIKAE